MSIILCDPPRKITVGSVTIIPVLKGLEDSIGHAVSDLSAPFCREIQWLFKCHHAKNLIAKMLRKTWNLNSVDGGRGRLTLSQPRAPLVAGLQVSLQWKHKM